MIKKFCNFTQKKMRKIGIIGGSGLDNPDIIENYKVLEYETIYGKPSTPLKTGQIEGVEVVFIGRHGLHHQITPTHVNNRANIQAMKEVGVTNIIATTAVGSLREDINRGDFVIIDQFIDFTRFRANTFYDTFKVSVEHTPMANPFDEEMRKLLFKACKQLSISVHEKGTLITIEGPRFSTKAESHLFRMWGADIINMSTAPECMLANEAKIPYSAIAMSTDYDCWKENETPVSFQEVVKIFEKNIHHVKAIIKSVMCEYAKLAINSRNS